MLSTSLKIGKIKYNGKNVNLFAGKTTTQSGSTVIKVADLAGVTFQLLDVDLNVLQTATTTSSNHSISFSVTSTGVYFVKNVTKDWIKSVEVKDIGVWYVTKDDILDTYTLAELHQICQEGLASTMFTPGSELLIQDSNSIYNNKYIFIEDIETLNNGKEQIHFRLSNYYSGGSYNINPYYAYLPTSAATSFTSTYSSEGGMKYSAMRQRCQAKGEETWSQATGIKPDDSTISTGIKFSEIYYTDGNGEKSGLYQYDGMQDLMTLLENFPDTQTQYVSLFVNGYFKSVGKIADEETFNAGHYYTYANYVYTPATTYSSSTTYYGFYKTLQDDGIFYAGFKSTFGDYIVKKEMVGSVGRTDITNTQTFSDYANMPCIEEIFGLNRNSKLKNGSSAMNANFYNIEGEGTKKDVYTFDLWTLGNPYWTRSVYSISSSYFCCVYNTGYCSNFYVYYTHYVRPGFVFA